MLQAESFIADFQLFAHMPQGKSVFLCHVEALCPYQESEFKEDKHRCWIEEFVCFDQAIPSWHWSS